MTGYQYRPLKNDEIRLVVLHAGVGDAPIRASIRHALAGDKAVVYDALSYCWGDGETKSLIVLDSCDFEVGEDLKSALLHLRKPSIDIVLWVDAICINQQDVEERSKQVLRMGSIYHRAATVRAWLGPTAEYSEFAMEYLQNAPARLLVYNAMSNYGQAIIALITRPWVSPPLGHTGSGFCNAGCFTLRVSIPSMVNLL